MPRTPRLVIATAVGALLATGPVACDAGSGGAGDVVTAPVPASPLSVRTTRVSLTADDFRVIVGDTIFRAGVPRIEAVSSPGDASFTTLQLAWEEHGVPMRLWMYFKSGGGTWWCDQIRTHDGTPEGAWLYYRGRYFERPVGQAFTGSVSIPSTPDAWTTNGTGTVELDGLDLMAFAPSR